MKTDKPVSCLRIYISSTDRIKDMPLSEWLVLEAKKSGLAGATAIRGFLGYGASSVIHSYKFWEVSEKVPVVVEMVDEQEKIRVFYEQIQPVLENLRNGCLVTQTGIDVWLYKAGTQKLLD